jgi:hypothetical protein
MTLGTGEFIRRFLLHLLPRGFHRIRHYGLISASARKVSLARARELPTVAPPPDDDLLEQPIDVHTPCPCCGGHMIVIETFAAAPAKPNREDCFVIRHGVHHARAAATVLRPVPQLVPDDVNGGDPVVSFHHHVSGRDQRTASIP